MKVVVTIKQILDPGGFVVKRKRERVFVNREEYIINPADLNALESALRLRDQNQLAEVTALSLGPDRVDDAIHEAMARGADRGMHILTDNENWIDAAATARLLAAAIDKLGDVRMVVCGAIALDSGGGEIPGRLAEALGWPILHIICAIENMEENVAQVVQRSRWQGQHLMFEVDLPAVFVVPTGVNRPRYIHGARAINAYQLWDVTTWTPTDLNFIPDDLEPLTTVTGRRFPPERTFGTILEGTAEQAVAALISQLRTRELI